MTATMPPPLPIERPSTSWRLARIIVLGVDPGARADAALGGARRVDDRRFRRSARNGRGARAAECAPLAARDPHHAAARALDRGAVHLRPQRALRRCRSGVLRRGHHLLVLGCARRRDGVDDREPGRRRIAERRRRPRLARQGRTPGVETARHARTLRGPRLPLRPDRRTRTRRGLRGHGVGQRSVPRPARLVRHALDAPLGVRSVVADRCDAGRHPPRRQPQHARVPVVREGDRADHGHQPPEGRGRHRSAPVDRHRACSSAAEHHAPTSSQAMPTTRCSRSVR